MSHERQTRLMVLIPDELLSAVEDYRFAHRVETRTEAIRQLIRSGLVHTAASTTRTARQKETA